MANWVPALLSSARTPRFSYRPLRAFTSIASSGNDLLLSAVDPPFADKRVRQAMSLALDRKRFADNVMYGLTQPTFVIWPRTSPAYDMASDTGEFNLERQHNYWPTPATPTDSARLFSRSSASFPELFQFLQIVQADFAKVGVNLSIQDIESTRALSQGKFSGAVRANVRLRRSRSRASVYCFPVPP